MMFLYPGRSERPAVPGTRVGAMGAIRERGQWRIRPGMTRGKRQEGNGHQSLSLHDLDKGQQPGISKGYGASLAEAATICLEERAHQTGVRLPVDGDFEEVFKVVWERSSSQMRACWADADFTTEQGAYGVAALLVPALTEMAIVSRSVRGTGFDFWIGRTDDAGPLFQNQSRLEVSGIRKGDGRSIQTRVQAKLKQTCRSDGLLPALVVVVEFGEPRSRVVRK